ncbi:hypothetical protein AVEN_101702-1 [Araneus ventricosus]|uniref:Uncharacterized protein n=1 Tax=Araneus ventricosus TaxID=182803 RepID=A0A4Y2MDW3_ARAVE|nr:hypothetical protein AVEN_101702-1 [Araneus ventricosus]
MIEPWKDEKILRWPQALATAPVWLYTPQHTQNRISGACGREEALINREIDFDQNSFIRSFQTKLKTLPNSAALGRAKRVRPLSEGSTTLPFRMNLLTPQQPRGSIGASDYPQDKK